MPRNLSYTRPTYVLAKSDKEKQANFKDDFRALKKLLNEEVDHILFEDESMIRDYQTIQKTWFPKVSKSEVRSTIPKFINHINKVPTETIDRLYVRM